MNIILAQKIDDLIAIAEQEDEKAIQVVLNVLRGSLSSGHENIVAHCCAELAKNTLLPLINSAQEMSKISKN